MCEINVTPMVDVLLCLLIIFMVASPPPANTQMPLDIPTASKSQSSHRAFRSLLAAPLPLTFALRIAPSVG